MKYIILAAALISTPAMAENVQTEVTFGNLSSNQPGSRSTRIEYNGEYKRLAYSIELEAQETIITDPRARAILSSLLGTEVKTLSTVTTVLGAGSNISTPIATISPQVQFGRSAIRGNKFEFWGFEVEATRKLIGPVNLNLSYRHRESINNKLMNVEQLSGGVSIRLTNKTNFDLVYYRNRGTDTSESVGGGFTRKF